MGDELSSQILSQTRFLAHGNAHERSFQNAIHVS